MFRAKRLETGKYLYRGVIIENVIVGTDPYSGLAETAWKVGGGRDPSYCDTLKDGKWEVDRMEAKKQTG